MNMQAIASASIALLWTGVALGQGLPLSTNNPSNANAPRQWADQDRLDQANDIEIDQLSFRKGEFRNALIASFVLKNNNTVGVRDIRIICEQTDADGAIVSTTDRTFYRALKPGATLSVSDFNMGTAHSKASISLCRVAGTAPAFD